MKNFRTDNIKIDNTTYKLYSIKFNDLYDLYNYLNNKGKSINPIFTNFYSENANSKTHGKSYEAALNDLLSVSYDKEYNDIVRILENTNNSVVVNNNYEVINKVCGGKINVRAYVTGNPLCYSVINETESKHISLYVSLSYNILTTDKQLINRALIITSLVNELENRGYKVDLNTFHLCKTSDELIYVDVQIKKEDTNLTTNSLYNSLCKVEFLRRILLRVIETCAVKNNEWGKTYGDVCDKDFAKKVLSLGERDIYFGEPKQIGILGRTLSEDFNNMLNNIKLDDLIDVNNTKENIKTIELKLKNR